VKPNIDYSPWSPVDVIDYPLDTKINKVRSILSSPPETANIKRNNKFSPANVKTATRRNFESASNDEQKLESQSTSIRPAYKRRTFSTSTANPSSTVKPLENAAGRFRSNRKPSEGVSATVKPRRQFTPRTTSENELTPENSSTTRVIFKKPTRGTFRPKTASKSNANDDGSSTGGDGENYPEHFKALLKNKEVITQHNDKSVLKKPSKVFRPTTTDKPTKAPVKKPNPALYSPRPRLVKSTTVLSTEASQSSTTEAVVTRRPTLRTRPPFRPTERAKLNIGSTLQEPPTAKTTPTYATRTPVNQILEEESMNVNTQITDDSIKQIDPPIYEPFFPRTSAVSLK
jgi:hypothetical protein